MKHENMHKSHLRKKNVTAGELSGSDCGNADIKSATLVYWSYSNQLGRCTGDQIVGLKGWIFSRMSCIGVFELTPFFVSSPHAPIIVDWGKVESHGAWKRVTG